MKILYIAPANSIHTYRWVNYFHKQGLDVALASADPAQFDFGFVDFYPIAMKHRSFKVNMLQGAWALWRLIRKLKPDLVHVHYLRRLGWVPALLHVHPLVITTWGSDLLHQEAFLNRNSYRLSCWSLRHSDLVTGDSPVLLTKAHEMGAKQTSLITFGVELDKFYCHPDRCALRQMYQIPPDSFVIFSPRAMSGLYNIHLILAAFMGLADQYPQLLLVLLDYNADPVYRQQLQETITQDHLTERVRILPAVSYNKLHEIYNLSDVAVSVPTTDGTPATFFEAMACGLPVLSVHHQAYDGIVTGGQDILWIEKLSAESLAAGLREILTGAVNLDTLRQNGLMTAQHNSFSQQMGFMMQAYQRLVMPNHT